MELRLLNKRLCGTRRTTVIGLHLIETHSLILKIVRADRQTRLFHFGYIVFTFTKMD